jgi:zinc/manganese transport system substrate-binding protein
VESLIPIGADPHDYQASSRQIADMMQADLVIANGLGLEASLSEVLDQIAADGGSVIEIGPLLDPEPLAELPGRLDPHVWLDPIRMADAAMIIAAELTVEFPSVDWDVMADRYSAQLLTADEEIRAILEAVPEGKRAVVTNHESLGYFARRYGLVVVATVIPGGSTLAEPSSAELAALVSVIEAAEVSAIFADTTSPDSLARAVAGEAGSEVAVVELFTESLGVPGSGAETLIEMLITDARLIAEGLA